MSERERIENEILNGLTLADIFDTQFLGNILKSYSEVSIEGVQKRITEIIREPYLKKIRTLQEEKKVLALKINLQEKKILILKNIFSGRPRSSKTKKREYVLLRKR